MIPRRPPATAFSPFTRPIHRITAAVASAFGLQPEDLRLRTNRRAIVRPRQVAMYLAKQATKASLPEIGRAFAGKHHTTVLHAIRKIDRERHRDPNLDQLIDALLHQSHPQPASTWPTAPHENDFSRLVGLA